MNVKSLAAAAALTLGTIVFVNNNGCGDDDDEDPRRFSRKGEACQVTNDCGPGLSCAPVPGGVGGLCVTGEFRVSVTARECATIQCEEATDCCDTPPPQCPQYLESCVDAGPSSPQCDFYEQECQCDEDHIGCEQNQCIEKCSTDTDCRSSSARVCAGGRCVQCSDDDDCGSEQQCLSGRCQAPCESDGDCAGFNRCQAGRCIPSGCQTDRECIAATRNVEATCGTDGKCIQPCQTDLECGNPRGYSFFSCINAQCIYVGCETDKDCRLLLTGASDAGTLPPKTHVVCRDKALPGSLTATPK